MDAPAHRSAGRIGILGGTFDPVHRGHLAAAVAARDSFQLDRVLFVVAKRSPMKQGPSAGPEDRLDLVRCALAGERGMEACDLELHRPEPSYSIDTVVELAGLHPGAALFWILGSDSLGTFARWKDVGRLLEVAQPIVVPRPGAGRELLTAASERLTPEQARRLTSGWIESAPVDVSSTELRRRLTAGEPLTGLVPPAVEARIRERGLYRWSPRAS